MSETRTTPQPSIHVLPPEVVERIAAGEVVERPASVVRELIENALDAGASSIRVEVKDGGMRLMRVADNGDGIPASELPLSVTTHATSKIARLTDLASLRTLGFRGEALASIAAMAELTICSAADESGVAHTLAQSADHEISVTRDARSRGTTVTVRDLFQNIPPRRATLRGSRAEGGRVLKVVRDYALIHPSVRLTLIVDGILRLQSTGADPTGAIRAVYGPDIARTRLAMGPHRVDSAELWGWIAPPSFSQPDRAHVLLAINGRPVSNSTLLAAVEKGYRPLLRRGRHPVVALQIRCEPAEIDVNVHPAKAEVLVRDERRLAAALREAVHNALAHAPIATRPQMPQTIGLYRRYDQPVLPLARRRRGVRLAEPHMRYAGARAIVDEPLPTRLPPLEALGQLDNALIVARSLHGHLYLVDQHRAHERLLYEAAQAAPAPGAASSRAQRLLEPLLIELTPRQEQILQTRVAELAELGMVCEPFGGTTFLVRALPVLPPEAIGAASFARELAVDACEDTDDWFDHVRISLACRAALRRGEALSTSDQQALLADLSTIDAYARCPHGSPIVVRYTKNALTKTFEW